MAKINLFGNAHQHSCVYTIDLKISSDIEVLIKISTQAHYVPMPVRMGDDKISNIFIIFGSIRGWR
jgi:hypothetical protein